MNYGITIEGTLNGNAISIEVSGILEVVTSSINILKTNGVSIDKITPNEKLLDLLSSSLLVQAQEQLDRKNEQDLNTLENQPLEL
jgi:hypothetical protein